MKTGRRAFGIARCQAINAQNTAQYGQSGGAPDGNALPIPKDHAETAMDAAACIGCGACVAACKNASEHLFVGAKITHLSLLQQGQQERYQRVVSMIAQADAEGFGSCSNEGECEAVCPAEISASFIAKLNREYARAAMRRSLEE